MNFVREGILVVADIFRQEIIQRKRRKRKIWVKKWIQRRNILGATSTLCLEFHVEDPELFQRMFRVSREQFDYLLGKVSPMIQKQTTMMREPIKARTKLEITLKYLASGDSFGTLSHVFRVPPCTISEFLTDVLKAIYMALEKYIKVPSSEEEWMSIRQGFESRWNFPNCVGAIDGKHVNIKCPPGSVSDYFNYKNTFSIVLMAVVDYDYCFTYIDVGAKGRSSDGGIFNNCTLKNAIDNNSINLPKNSVFVGDEAFPLKPYLMKPYPRRGNLSKEQRIFNYRLCRCRRIVENAFGILVSRFRIFERCISLVPEKVDHVVKTACALHNWLRKTSPSSYTPPGYVDEENNTELTQGSWRQNYTCQAFADNTAQNYGNTTREALAVREKYCLYFNNRGAVPWQDNAINNSS